MSDNKFIPLKKFIENKFEAVKPRYASFGEKPPALSEYLKTYLIGHGFNDWLLTMSGIELTERQAFSIANTYVKHGDRKVADLLYIFVSIERCYNITLPAIHGILTIGYWEKRLASRKKEAA